MHQNLQVLAQGSPPMWLIVIFILGAVIYVAFEDHLPRVPPMVWVFGFFLIAALAGVQKYQWIFDALLLMLGLLVIFGVIFGIVALADRTKARDAEKTTELPNEATPGAPVLRNVPSNFFYYLSPKNEKIGPLSLEVLKQLKNSGVINDQTLVAQEGAKSWRRLVEFF